MYEKDGPDMSSDGFLYVSIKDGEFSCPCCSEKIKSSTMKGSITCPSCGEGVELDGFFVKARVDLDYIDSSYDDDDEDED